MTLSTNTKFVAVDSGIAAGAGAVVYWALSGDVSHADLCGRLDAVGLDRMHPRKVTEEQALKRALDSIAGRRTLIRPLARRGAYSVVVETAGEQLAHKEVVRAWVNPMGSMELMTVDQSTDQSMLIARIREEFTAALATLSTADLSVWLVSQVSPALDAVTLRDRGGVIFVPRDRIALLETVAGLIGAGNVIFRIPAMHAEQAADAVLAAIEAEARAAVSEVEAWVADGTEHGARAVLAREDDLKATGAKLRRYEELFGRRLGAVTDRLASVRRQLAGVASIRGAVAEGRDIGGRFLDLEDRAPAAEVSQESDGADARFSQLEID